MEGEGERHGRPVAHLSLDRDPPPRALVHLIVCLFAGTLFCAILVCWLVRAGEQASRMNFSNDLREIGMRVAAGELKPEDWQPRERPVVRSSAAEAGVLLCFRAGAITLGTLLGAMFLCTAGSLYNSFAGAGSSRRVPRMVFGKAVAIALVAAVVHLSLGAGLLPALAVFLVLAILTAVVLPTTFARGLLVALCYLLVTLIVFAVLLVSFGGPLLLRATLR